VRTTFARDDDAGDAARGMIGSAREEPPTLAV
jgi:hypothetical protein